MNQFELNKQIQQLILKKDKAGETYSFDEKKFIAQYEGSGGQGSKGATGEGVLYEFFTPDFVCELMWKLAYRYGFKAGGSVLEPSLGTGNLLKWAPNNSKCYGFEINPISKRITEILYPDAKIYEGYFETAFLQEPRYTARLKDKLTWLEGYPFSLVIGNPPYGKYKNKYSSYFTKPKMHQIELFFMHYGLQLLKPGGIMVFITGSNFLRNGISYQSEKLEIEKLADIVDAYRLPPVFKFSKVPTDIIVLKRK
ncbi:N-6 DNA methylase [Flavobacterium sp.]|uniref:Eco57I restriction-modification methylase domain-containing protein n=1 Tax=Flavobacterium sp. TaxID=239 RepID=UPI0025E1F2CC|nr:N-6 DNA methylase [Flavobacterium sp.]